jgi:Lrp/AsnC family transcriptional regulator, leucine-responsive regulatory protein
MTFTLDSSINRNGVNSTQRAQQVFSFSGGNARIRAAHPQTQAPEQQVSELDALDLKILDLLQHEGRLTMTELGDRIGLSTSPCSQRVKRLERMGVITGYHAKLDALAVGKSLLVFVEITLAEKSEQIFKKVRDELQHMPEVLECHLVSGSFDYLVKARLGGMSEYRQLLGNMLKRIPVPAQSNSYVVMEEIKESFTLRLMRSNAKQ